MPLPIAVAQALRQSRVDPGIEQHHIHGRAHVAFTASANYQRIVAILADLELTWCSVRYIRQVVLQRAEGIELADLSSADTPRSAGASNGQHETPDGWLSQNRQ